MGSTQLSLIIVSIVRNKYLAINIGPEGFGLFSLLSSFFQLGDIIAGAGLGTATIKYISECNRNKDKEGVQNIFDFSFSVVFILAFIVTIIFILFYNFFKEVFLTDSVSFFYYVLFASSYFGTILSSVFISLLNGLILTNSMAKRKFFTSVFNLCSILVLVYFFQLTGFFLSILLTSIFSLYLFYLASIKVINVKFIRPKFSSSIAKKIMSFSFVDFFLIFINYGTTYLQRIIVVRVLDMSSLGIYSSALSFNKYLGVVSDGSLFYFFPKMSESLSTDERNKVLNDYFRLTIMPSVLISLFAILLGPYVIPLLFSSKFNELNKIFYVFVLAQFVLSVQTGYMYTVVGMAKLKIHTIATIIAHLIIVIIPFLFIQQFGVIILGIAMIVSSSIHILINSIYLYLGYKTHMSKSNFSLFTLSVILILLSNIIRDYSLGTKILFVLVSIIVVAKHINKNEWVSIIKITKNYFRKQNDNC